MRLIDANSFKSQIAAYAIQNNIDPQKANVLCSIVDQQPTAFDIQKLIENIKKTVCYDSNGFVDPNVIIAMINGEWDGC